MSARRQAELCRLHGTRACAMVDFAALLTVFRATVSWVLARAVGRRYVPSTAPLEGSETSPADRDAAHEVA
jgi:hypothetical protein